MASSTSRPEGLVAAVSTIKEAVNKIIIGTDPVTGQSIYEEVPLVSSDPGFNNKVDLVEELKENWDGSAQTLVLRGIEGGPGITVEVIDADSIAGTVGGKIVISSTTAAGVGEVNTASNIGLGTGIYASKTGADLRFKSIKSTGNINISSDADSITISSDGEANILSSIGSGESIVGQKSGTSLQVKSLVAGSGIRLTSNAGDITITNTNNGEANTGSNIGTGVGVFANKIDADLRFRSIAAGSNKVSVVDNNGTITIDVPSIGEVNQGQSLGGQAIFAGMNGTNLTFKGLVAGSNIQLTPSTTGITINAVNVGEVNDGVNINALDPNKVDVFAGKVGTDFRFRRIAASGSVAVSQDANTIYISGTGEANAAINVGTSGSGIFKGKDAVSSELQFRSIIGTSGIVVTQNTNDITISTTAKNNQGVNLGTTGATVFAGMSGDNLSFRRIVAGSAGVSVVEVGDTVQISVTGTSSGEVNDGANIGTLGQGLYIAKSGPTLQFKNIASGSSKVVISADAANNVLVDINEAAFTIGNLSGSLALTKLTTTGSANGNVLTIVGGVPTWQAPDAVNVPVTSVNGKTGAVSLKISDIADVAITNIQTDNVLKWNGSAWINAVVPVTGGVGIQTIQPKTGELALVVTNGSGPNATIALDQTKISITKSQISDFPTFGSAAYLNVGTTANTVASGDHTHSNLVADSNGHITINNITYATSGVTPVSLPIGLNNSVVTLPTGTEMMIIDYFAVSGTDVSTGTVSFVKTGTLPAVFTDTGTGIGPNLITFEINTAGTGLNIIADVNVSFKYAVRAF